MTLSLEIRVCDEVDVSKSLVLSVCLCSCVHACNSHKKTLFYFISPNSLLPLQYQFVLVYEFKPFRSFCFKWLLNEHYFCVNVSVIPSTVVAFQV